MLSVQIAGAVLIIGGSFETGYPGQSIGANRYLSWLQADGNSVRKSLKIFAAPGCKSFHDVAPAPFQRSAPVRRMEEPLHFPGQVHS